MAHPLQDSGAWMLDPDVVHANHGSFGGITRATWDAVTVARARVAADPMQFFERDWEAAHGAARDQVAALLGASADALQLVPNATFGLDLALRVLPSGGRVVRTDHAYPSVVGALDAWATRTGGTVEVVALPLDADPGRDAETVLAATQHADAAVLDACASATARWLPLAQLVPQLRARGTTVVVDAAHVPGQVPAEVDALGADAWVGNLHKWACAPHALAAIVLHPRHASFVGPLVHSAASGTSDFPDGSAWWGTTDPGPMLVAGQVVDQARDVLGALAPSIEAMVVDGADRVADRVGGRVVGGGRGWMRVVELPAAGGAGRDTARQVMAGLRTHGVEAKVSPWQDRLLLRLSAHAYTRPEDHERLATALADVLGR